MAARLIKVLVVEDSAVMREMLVHILRSHGEFSVVGAARDGAEALALMAQVQPDVVTMDINMPRLDGFAVTRQIMETCPVPVVIVSASCRPEEVATTFRAVEAGAVAVVEKPRGIGHPDFAASRDRLLETIKRMAEVKVVRRWARRNRAAPDLPAERLMAAVPRRAIGLVAIGSSTGGPLALQTILSGLGPAFGAPLVIVQHIAAGFAAGMVDWLTQTTGFPTQLARAGQLPRAGTAYLAPDGSHLGLDSTGCLTLNRAPLEAGLRPAVSYLFRGVADVFGRRAVGILLSGMGKDGAAELKRLKDLGAITMVQDKASSVVHGMPGEAIRLDGATYVLTPQRMVAMLHKLVPALGRQTKEP